METLVEELLVDHYDPLYLRSIKRNFAQIGQAQQLELANIAEDNFRKAALSLMSE